MQQPKTQYADSHGVSIAYQVIGDGPFDLVIVPGFISNVETFWAEPIFYRFISNLTRVCRVIVFDKRGTGCSDPVTGAPSVDERMDDVRAVMDAAGVERAVVQGVSEGGPIAILFAATYPERTQGLVLYGTAPKTEAPGEPELDLGGLATLAECLGSWGEGRTIEVFAPDLAHDAMQRRMWGVWERTGASPGMARALYQALTTWDVRSVLPSVTVPTLVVHRTGDRAVSVAGGRYLAEHIPGAKMVELPGQNHLIFEPEIIDAMCGAIEEFVLGSRHAAETERVLKTVLFTDIVGSTERAASEGDRRWRSLLGDHDAMVRHALERHRGTEVKSLGDGFLATFEAPARAVQCARQLAHDVSSLGIAIRSGVHTGECEIIGADIGGLAVHLAARVAALAGSGEVLVSSTVRELVVGSQLCFEDRGRHQLKGVPGDWQLYAAVEETAPPAPLALSTTTPATGFSERAMEAVALKTPRLARAGTRLSRRVAAARR